MHNNIYNISTDYNFCKTLHRFVKDNYSEVDKVTIFLPSQRICRELKEVFLSEKTISSIPKIKTLTDIDVNDFWLVKKTSWQTIQEIKDMIEDCLSYRVIKDLDEIFYIANLVQKTKLFGSGHNLSYYIKIAQNFSEIFNELEYENIDNNQFKFIDDSNLAIHRQVTLSFLQDFYLYIKNFLLKDRILLKSSHYSYIVKNFCKLLENNDLESPVIIAGSTGSIKINQFFIKSIQSKSLAKVILSNYQEVEQPLEVNPQFFNNNLVKTLAKSKITEINYPDFYESKKQRQNLIKNIFVDSGNIKSWQKIDQKIIDELRDDISNNFSIIEAKDKYDEARTISKILKEYHNQRVCIISNNNDLTKIIRYQLINDGFVFNDGICHEIANSNLINFLQLVLNFYCNEFNSASFLAIVKNKLCKYSDNYQLIKDFESKILRQQRISDNFAGITDKLERVNDSKLLEFWNSFNNDLAPIKNNKLKLSQHISSLIASIENLTNKNLLDLINFEECSIEIYDFISFLTRNEEFYCFFFELNDIIDSIINSVNFFRKTNSDLNINLMTSIEARLINYDVIIVTDLNDKSFPKADNENWLGLKIRKDLGIYRAKKQIGQNANDFCHYLSLKKVILTRSLTENGIKKSPSQFWLRFNLFCQSLSIKPRIIKNQIDSSIKISEYNINNGFRNNIKIDSISVTDIVKLIKDPYSIFAKKILNLKELNKIDYKPSNKEFGSFIHEALEHYINLPNSEISSYKQIFKKHFIDSNSDIIWWSKFENILQNFVSLNEIYSDHKNLTEYTVSSDIKNIKIIGKIDRLIIDKLNNIDLIDYKTGSIPAKKNCKNGIEPQLSILAYLLNDHIQSGKVFNKLANISTLQYWKISAKNNNNKIDIIANNEDIGELIDQVKLNLEKLLNYYFVEDNQFISFKCDEFSVYKHLTRIES